MQDEILTEEEQTTIDRLIPPPWSAWKQGTAAAIVAALVIGFGVLWFDGWLSPNLELSGGQWGGDGPVVMGVNVTNNGSRSIRILDTDTAAGLERLSTTAGDETLPYILHPGQTALVLSTYEVTDCSLINDSDYYYDLEVEFAGGPLSMRRDITVDLRGMVFDERVGNAEMSAWPAAASQYVCG